MNMLCCSFEIKIRQVIRGAKISCVSSEGWNELMGQMEFPGEYPRISHSLNIVFQTFHKESGTCFPWWEKKTRKDSVQSLLLLVTK